MDEFLATATEIVNDLENELRRARPEVCRGWRALEIGCGSGRLIRAISRHFLEIHGMDASPDYISEAKQNLSDLSNAQVHLGETTNLLGLGDDSFDFVYYLNASVHNIEAIRRILKIGGLARLRFQNSTQTRAELLEFMQRNNFQTLAYERIAGQLVWITLCKQPEGWGASYESRTAALNEAWVIIRRIVNAATDEPVAPSRGRFASVRIRAENLPSDIGLYELRVTIGSSFATVIRIGPLDKSGWRELKVDLPDLEATGLLPVQILLFDRAISTPLVLRVIPPGPSVPQIISVVKRSGTRRYKVIVEEIAHPEEIAIYVAGFPVNDLEFRCLDPRPQRFELNFRLPDEAGPGLQHIKMRMGRRKLPPVPIEVGQAG